MQWRAPRDTQSSRTGRTHIQDSWDEGLPGHILALVPNSNLNTELCNRPMISSKASKTTRLLTYIDFSGFSKKSTKKSLVTVTEHVGTR